MTLHTHAEATERWRVSMDEALRRDDGWLSLAGLFWLDAGPNVMGADPDCVIALPSQHLPAIVGTFTLDAGVVSFTPQPGIPIAINGAPAATQVLRHDMDGTPDLLAIETFSMFVIKRGPRFAIRLRDHHNPAIAAFEGRRWFPVQDQYRVAARFEPYDPPRPMQITDVTGFTTEGLSPGAVHFELDGTEYYLDASPSSGEGLFLVFRDASSGVQTYGAGRFLGTDAPVDQCVTLDFNRAYNPPCAFTPFATCPLPTKQNRLPIAILAGELPPRDHA